MNTILYGISGIIVLIGSAFLFTYFDDVAALMARGRESATELGRRSWPRIGGYLRMALRISDRNGYYPTSRK